MMKWKFALAALVVGGAALLSSTERADASSFLKRCCTPPPPPQKVILQVCHPCTGCKHEVEACIPACCTDVPHVCFQNTLIGHGKTVFEWNCGYVVVVRYPPGGGTRVFHHDLR